VSEKEILSVDQFADENREIRNYVKFITRAPRPIVADGGVWCRMDEKKARHLKKTHAEAREPLYFEKNLVSLDADGPILAVERREEELKGVQTADDGKAAQGGGGQA